jgi:hypothetical protein
MLIGQLRFGAHGQLRFRAHANASTLSPFVSAPFLDVISAYKRGCLMRMGVLFPTLAAYLRRCGAEEDGHDEPASGGG